jgi:hypothetical protein
MPYYPATPNALQQDLLTSSIIASIGVVCPTPPNITDASHNVTNTNRNFTEGNTIAYTCKRHFRPHGNNTRKCLKNATWSWTYFHCTGRSTRLHAVKSLLKQQTRADDDSQASPPPPNRGRRMKVCVCGRGWGRVVTISCHNRALLHCPTLRKTLTPD